MGSDDKANRGVAVVTGASSGIGLEFARHLAAGGQPVLAIARRGDRLEQLAAEAKQNGWAQVHPFVFDVSRDDAPEAIRARAEQIGPVEWLINNAGTAKWRPMVETSVADAAVQVRVNCESVVAITTALLPGMVKRGRGHILNMGSTAGFQPLVLMSIYSAAKAFINSYSQALSMELHGTGVTVTVICPGPVATELYAVADAGRSRKAPPHELSAEATARFGLAAARRGAVFAVPGARNKAVSILMPALPRSLVRAVMRRLGLAYLGYEPGMALPNASGGGP